MQEPDPRDDLSGTDVARKLTILSRLVPSSPRLTEGFASVPTQSLVPDVLADVSTKEEFMDRLSEGDAYFDGLREEAKKEGMVVRYVGVLDVKARTVEAKLEKSVQSGREEMHELMVVEDTRLITPSPCR